MTANKQLRELAEGAAHWSGSLAHVWPSDPDFNDAWTVGTIDEDGNKYPVIEVDADQYDAPGDSERLARFFTAANPAAVLALLDSYEALQADRDQQYQMKVKARKQLDRVAAELKTLQAAFEELRTALFESQANDRQAMYYLNQIRWMVGGDDFPDMVRRCEQLRKDAEFGRSVLAKREPGKVYGCHCDLDEGMEPDGCVIDSGESHNCIYAKDILVKEQCEYWRVIASDTAIGGEDQ